MALKTPVTGQNVQSPADASYRRKPQILGRDVLISYRLFLVPNMPRCSDCHCDLPGFETLCSKCLEARYSELSHPKSVLESMQQFASNPMGITPESEHK